MFYSKRNHEFPKLLFDFNHTPSHWCSEETMQKLISVLEQHRQRVCEEKGLAADQKMVLLLDVYCRHRDQSLFAYIRAHCPNIIITFVPANLTPLCQPLDVGFNFVFKRNIAQARQQRDMKRVVAYTAEHGADADCSEMQHAHKLSQVRDPLVMDLLNTAVVWSTAAKAVEIKKDCWKPIGLLECFNSECQNKALLAVGEDTEVKYFSKGTVVVEVGGRAGVTYTD
jgi:hypothetical protein